MEIVIDIDDDLYKSVVNNDAYVLEDVDWILLENAIANSTPLPKGHGDLVDRIEVIKSLFDYHEGKKTIGQCVEDVQTIIEADGGSEDEDSN